MQDLEPYYGWRDIYISEEDSKSPFFNKVYNELHYTNKLYNFLIHPQWDVIGSPTLFIKLLYINYEKQIAIIELFGEWNDAIHNDIMFLKRNILDVLLKENINKFVLIGENIINFHRGDLDYYEELSTDIGDSNGWIFGLNFEPHVILEMQRGKLNQFIMFNEEVHLNWRAQSPFTFHKWINQFIQKNMLS